MLYDVTIGMPVFQACEFLRASMLSALEQSFPSIEFLIVDDGSYDDSRFIIEEMQQAHPKGKNIRILRNSKNLGVSYSRNRIIDEAKGKYIYFMDSDDTIEPDTISLLFESAEKQQAEIVYASYEIVDLPDQQCNEIYQKDSLILHGDGRLAVYAFSHVDVFHVSICNCLINLAFLRQSGVRFINVKYWEDMAFTYELLPKVSRAALLSDITYHYLRHPDSLSHYQAREQFGKEEFLANVSTLDYMKSKCREHIGKSFLPYMCYNIELNSFYVICRIMKHACNIIPPFTHHEMRDILCHPLSLSDILRFRSMLLQNLLFWLIGRLPIPLFSVSVKVLGKLKRAI